MSRGTIVGGRVLWPGAAAPEPATLAWADGVIGARARGAADVLDADGALVLPGIVDLHGDAFERALMPRGGVPIDVDVALADNDVQLLAAGITTSFLSATDSWEPGLRSRRTLRDIVAALGRRRGGPDVQLHVRHERCNTDDVDELEAWIDEGVIRLLSFNDHTPDQSAHLSPVQVERAGVARDALVEVQAAAIARRGLGSEQERKLAAAAERAGCATASHDPDDAAHVERDLAIGVAVAEFPTSVTLARRYRDAGVAVLLGAPNLVRGVSHLGNLSVRDAVAADAADLLCSDYHYPSLLQAPFVLAEAGLRSFGEAWAMVAEAPARAVGLADRGRLAHGARADVLVVEPPEGAPARVRAAVVAGEVVLRLP